MLSNAFSTQRCLGFLGALTDTDETGGRWGSGWKAGGWALQAGIIASREP